MRCRLVVSVMVFLLPFVVRADDRVPVPDSAAQAKANSLLLELYAEEIKRATSPQAQAAVTKQLLDGAEQADPVEGYAMLRLAINVAPDVHVALSIVERMAKRFQIDELDAKAYTIGKRAKSAATVDERKAVAMTAKNLVDLYVENDDFEPALALGKLAAAAAGRSKDSDLIRLVNSKNAAVKALEKRYAVVLKALVALEDNPTDGKSSLIVGKYKCFHKGNWQDGLPMLALGEDEALKQLATQELKDPKSPDSQVALADRWYDVAQRSSEPDKRRMRQRAQHWYQKSLASQPPIKSLLRAKVENRLALLEKANADTASKPSRRPKRKGRVNRLFVEALVDGDSALHITSDGIYWKSHTVAKPGRHAGRNEPTWINGKAWMPKWSKPEADQGRDTSAVLPLPIGGVDNVTFKVMAVGPERETRTIDRRSPVRGEKSGSEFVITIPDSESGSRWYRILVVFDGNG